MVINVVRWILPIQPFIKPGLMMTHLRLIYPAVDFAWSAFPEVPRCWPWFLSVVIRFVVTPTWDVVGTTTIYTNGVTHTCFCGDMAHFCSMGPGSASCAENILTAVLPEVIHTSTGSASYLWPTCGPMGAGAVVWSLASEFFTGPPLDYFTTVSTCSWVAVKELILLTLPLLWVGSKIFKLAPTISFGIDVGLVVPCCEKVLPTSGMGL